MELINTTEFVYNASNIFQHLEAQIFHNSTMLNTVPVSAALHAFAR